MYQNVAWAEAYLHTKWHRDASSRLATIDMGRKLGGGFARFLWKGSWVPSHTKSPGPNPTYMSSGILILPAVWPQQILAENCVRRRLSSPRKRGAHPPIFGPRL